MNRSVEPELLDMSRSKTERTSSFCNTAARTQKLLYHLDALCMRIP